MFVHDALFVRGATVRARCGGLYALRRFCGPLGIFSAILEVQSFVSGATVCILPCFSGAIVFRESCGADLLRLLDS